MSIFEGLPDFFIVNSPFLYLAVLLVLSATFCIAVCVYILAKNSSLFSTKVEWALVPASNNMLKHAIYVLLSPLLIVGLTIPPVLATKSINSLRTSEYTRVILDPKLIEKDHDSGGVAFTFSSSILGKDRGVITTRLWVPAVTASVIEKVAFYPDSFVALNYKKGSLGLWDLESISLVLQDNSCKDGYCSKGDAVFNPQQLSTPEN